MSDLQFDSWRSGLGFDLGTYCDGLTYLDAERFGFSTADLSITSESAPNGKQLRVYRVGDVTYLSYNSM